MADPFPSPQPPRGADPIPLWAEKLVRFLDDGFVVPGTSFRVGFDAVLGLIPGVGDFVTSASSLTLLWLAYERRLPKAVLARMFLNIGADALVGAIPVLGDLFDIVFKANRRNLRLLERYDSAPKEAATRDWAFLAMIAVGVLTLLTGPVFLALVLFRLVFE